MDAADVPDPPAVRVAGRERTSADRRHDTARRRWIAQHHGWEIIVVTKEDIFYRPAPFLEALTTTLMHRGWHPTPTQLAKLELKLTRLRRNPPIRRFPE